MSKMLDPLVTCLIEGSEPPSSSPALGIFGALEGYKQAEEIDNCEMKIDWTPVSFLEGFVKII